MINITNFFIVKKSNLDLILSELNLTLNDSDYFISLILSNIFAYLIILLFIIAVLYIWKKIKIKIRRIFT